MEQSFKAIARASVAQEAGVEDSIISVKLWLSRIDKEWLLIFDNADGDPNLVSKYIPPGTRGNILFTSRNPMIALHVHLEHYGVEVDAMDEEEAIALLLKTARLDDSPSDLITPAKAIVTTLCCLPLAIDQAGAAIYSNMCTIHDYVQLYAIRRHELLPFPSFEEASDSDKAAYTTWHMSYMAIHADASRTSNLAKSQATKCAIMLLEIFAFFHHENISEEILRRAAVALPYKSSFSVETKEEIFDQDTLDETSQRLISSGLLRLDHSGKWDPLFFGSGIHILLSFSLIKKSGTHDSYFEHPLVHLWSRDRLSDEIQEAQRGLATALLAESITPEQHSSDYAFRRDLIPHIISCAAGPNGTRMYKEDECIRFALAYYENGFLKEAAELEVRVTEITKKDLGEEHPNTLMSMENLAVTYSELGKEKEAEELVVQVLEVRKRVLGDKHSHTLMSMENLAVRYSKQGRQEEAEELGVRVLEIRMGILGVEHPDTLMSMAHLAVIYSRQGRQKEAEELKVRVLEIRKVVLGEEHPDTLMSMVTLAATYSKQGRKEEAEELKDQVLNISKT